MIPHALIRRVGGRKVNASDFRRWRALDASSPATLPPAAVAAFTDPDGVHAVADLSVEILSNRFGVPGTVAFPRRTPAAGSDPIATLIDSDTDVTKTGFGWAGTALKRIGGPRPKNLVAAPNTPLWDYGSDTTPRMQPVNDSPTTDGARIAYADTGAVWAFDPRRIGGGSGPLKLCPRGTGNNYQLVFSDSAGTRTFTVVLKITANAPVTVQLGIEDLEGYGATVVSPAVTVPADNDGNLKRLVFTLTMPTADPTTYPAPVSFRPRPFALISGGGTRVEFADAQMYCGQERPDYLGLAVAVPPNDGGGLAEFDISFYSPRPVNSVETFGSTAVNGIGTQVTGISAFGYDSGLGGVGDGPNAIARWSNDSAESGVSVFIEEVQQWNGSMVGNNDGTSYLRPIYLVEIDPQYVIDLGTELVDASVEWARESDPSQVTSPFGNYESATLTMTLDNTDNAWSPEANPLLDVGHRVLTAFGVRYSQQLANPRFDVDAAGWESPLPASARRRLDNDTDGIPYLAPGVPAAERFVTLDTDGVPYFATSGTGERPVYVDTDGVPYFRSSSAATVTRVPAAGTSPPSPYAGRITAAVADDMTWSNSSSILTAAGDRWSAEGYVRLTGDPGAVATIAVTYFASSTTRDPSLAIGRTEVTSIGPGGWVKLRTAIADAPAGTQAVRVEVTVGGNTAAPATLDFTRCRLVQYDAAGKSIELEALIPQGVFFTEPIDTDTGSETVQITALDRLGRWQDGTVSEPLIVSSPTGGPGGTWSPTLTTVVTNLARKYLYAQADQVKIAPGLDALVKVPYLWGSGQIGTYLADLAKAGGGSLYVDAVDTVRIDLINSATTPVVAQIRGDNSLIKYTRPPAYDTTTSRVRVTGSPLAPGSGFDAWAMPSGGITLAPGETRKIVAPYSQVPVLNPGVTGVVADGAYSLSTVYYSDRAELTFTNSSGGPRVIADAHVAATQLVEQPVAAEASDAASLKRYGDRLLDVQARLAATPVMVQALADALLSTFKSVGNDGVRRLPELTLDGMGLPHLSAGDRVLVANTRTGLSEPFYLLGRRLTFDNTGAMLSSDVRVRSVTGRTLTDLPTKVPATTNDGVPSAGSIGT